MNVVRTVLMYAAALACLGWTSTMITITATAFINDRARRANGIRLAGVDMRQSHVDFVLRTVFVTAPIMLASALYIGLVGQLGTFGALVGMAIVILVVVFVVWAGPVILRRNARGFAMRAFVVCAGGIGAAIMAGIAWMDQPSVWVAGVARQQLDPVMAFIAITFAVYVLTDYIVDVLGQLIEDRRSTPQAVTT